MNFKLTIKDLKRPIKELSKIMHIIGISKVIVYDNVTEIEYIVKEKAYKIKHNGTELKVKKAEDTQFIFNWYAGTNEVIDINKLNELVFPKIKLINH